MYIDEKIAVIHWEECILNIMIFNLSKWYQNTSIALIIKTRMEVMITNTALVIIVVMCLWDQCVICCPQILLRAGCNANLSNSRGLNPLHTVCLSGCLGIVKQLLGHGADLDWIDCNGRTPLMMAAGQGHVEVVKALLKAGQFVGPILDDRLKERYMKP